MSALDFVIIIVRICLAAFVPLCFVAILVWLERRGAGFIQDRSGPNRCNVLGFRAGGLIQNIADAIKLIFKEDVVPDHIKHKAYFILAPTLVFITASLSFSVVPFADSLILNNRTYLMQALPMNLGILWFLAIVGFGVYGIILAGWSSHNKYGVLGGLRAAAQVISYEIPMGLAIISLLIVYGTVNLGEIAQFQGKLLFGFIPLWGVFLQPIAAIIFIVAAFAETNRTPFDLAEGESELVAGFHVEYSSMKFTLFFMGEYVAMFVSSAMIVTLFFGSYQIPWLNTEALLRYSKPVVTALLAGIPVLTFLFVAWMKKNNKSHYDRPNDPRVKEANVYAVLIWIMVLIIEAILVGFLVYATAGGAAERILVTVLQICTLLLKTFLMCFVFIWVRWTLPRFRYDQLQMLGWKTLIPLALLNIFVTSAVVVTL